MLARALPCLARMVNARAGEVAFPLPLPPVLALVLMRFDTGSIEDDKFVIREKANLKSPSLINVFPAPPPCLLLVASSVSLLQLFFSIDATVKLLSYLSLAMCTYVSKSKATLVTTGETHIDRLRETERCAPSAFAIAAKATDRNGMHFLSNPN